MANRRTRIRVAAGPSWRRTQAALGACLAAATAGRPTSGPAAHRCCRVALPKLPLTMIKSGAAARHRGGASRATLSLGGRSRGRAAIADRLRQIIWLQSRVHSSGDADQSSSPNDCPPRGWHVKGASLRSASLRDRLSPTLDVPATRMVAAPIEEDGHGPGCFVAESEIHARSRQPRPPR